MKSWRAPSRFLWPLKQEALQATFAVRVLREAVGVESAPSWVVTVPAASSSTGRSVLWRKGSFGSASEAGSHLVERMLTVTVALRAQ